MKINILIIFAGFLLCACNGQQTGRLDQREAHYEIHERMDRDLQELERRHSNLKHEHDQWVVGRRDTLPNGSLRTMEQRHTEIEASHAQTIAEHHKLMEEHQAFFETKDNMDIPKDQWRARYKEIEGEHERMEKEHKEMREDHDKMKVEHQNLEAGLSDQEN